MLRAVVHKLVRAVTQINVAIVFLPSIFRSDGVHNRLISHCYVGDKNGRHVSEKICFVKDVMNTVAPQSSC